MTVSARQSVRKKFAVRHFTNITTTCPFNRAELTRWLDSGKCKQAQMVRRILAADSDVITCSYYLKHKQGRLIPYPWPNFTFLNRGARAIAAIDTRMIDIDIINAHMSITANIGAMCGMSRADLATLLEYNENREDVLRALMQETRCDRDAVKELFLIILYCDSELTWAREHSVKCSKKLLAVTKPMRQQLKAVRQTAIASFMRADCADDDNIFAGIASSAKTKLSAHDIEKKRWSRLCMHFERAALLEICKVAQSATYSCDVCQLLYDGAQIRPPLPGTPRRAGDNARHAPGMFALRDLESDVDVALATVAGMTHYPLHVKCKPFQLPDAYLAKKREMFLLDQLRLMAGIDSGSDRMNLLTEIMHPPKSVAQMLWGPDGLDPIANSHVL